MLKKFPTTPNFIYLANLVKIFQYSYFSNYWFIFFLNLHQIKIKIFNNFKTNFLKISSNRWNTRQKFKGLALKLKKKSLVNVMSSFERKMKNRRFLNVNYLPLLYPSFFLRYSFIFNKNWNFLIGNLISPFYWDFLPKKKQYRFINKIQYKFNKRAKLSKHLKPFKQNKFNMKNKNNKNTIKQPLTFNFKKRPMLLTHNNKLVNLSKSTFRFLISTKSTFSRNKNIFSRPYLFFNNTLISSLPFENTLDKLSNSFWKRIKTFSSIKPNLARVINYSSITTIFNQYYKILEQFKKHSNLDYVFIRDRNIGNVSAAYVKKFNKKKQIKVKIKSRKFVLKIRGVFSLFLSRITHKYDNPISLRNKLSLLPKAKLFKKINYILGWNMFMKKNECASFKMTNIKYRYIFRRQTPSLTKFNIIPSKYRFKALNLIKNFFFNQRFLRLTLRKRAIFFNKFITTIDNNFTNSPIFKKLKKPLFFTFEKTCFSSDIDGFVYLNNYEDSNLTTSKIYNLKRTSYSFIFKNEIHKYILKKYSKIAWAGAGESYEINPFFINKTLNPYSISLTNNLASATSIKSHLSLFNTEVLISKKWNFFKNHLESQFNLCEYSGEITINRIRFKPGYSSQWRDARTAFKLMHDLKMRYQYKLTRYLMRYLKIKSSNFFLLFELELQNILMRSRLIPDKNLIFILLNRNSIYINGLMSNNGKLQLYVNDFIQLVVSLKYYVVYKQLINWSIKKKSKLRRIIFSKIPSESETEDKKRSNHLPNSILSNEGVNDDTIKFAEIDYFTLSIFIIYEPFTWRELNSFNILRYRPITLRLYNWKYIT